MTDILDIARWSPSGDNTQVWRFRLTGDASCEIHTFDTRDQVVYDVDGHPSHLSVGMLLETLRIAASTRHYRARITRRPDQAGAKGPVFELVLEHDAELKADALAPFITQRSVQRRPMQRRALSAAEKTQLEAAAGKGYKVVWFEGAKRLTIAKLLFANAKIRLTMPEAFEVHRKVIQWDAKFSEDRLPDQAVGLDPVALGLMKWAMHSWDRVKFLNTWLAGTWMPRIQLDFIPSLACAAHFVLLADKSLDTVDDYIEGGRAMQRFWLTACSLGLQLQPEYTPLVFSAYVRGNKRFTAEPGLWEQAVTLTDQLHALLPGQQLGAAVFMGRTGEAPAATSRSTRLPLSRLLIDTPDLRDI